MRITGELFFKSSLMWVAPRTARSSLTGMNAFFYSLSARRRIKNAEIGAQQESRRGKNMNHYQKEGRMLLHIDFFPP